MMASLVATCGVIVILAGVLVALGMAVQRLEPANRRSPAASGPWRSPGPTARFRSEPHSARILPFTPKRVAKPKLPSGEPPPIAARRRPRYRDGRWTVHHDRSSPLDFLDHV